MSTAEILSLYLGVVLSHCHISKNRIVQPEVLDFSLIQGPSNRRANIVATPRVPRYHAKCSDIVSIYSSDALSTHFECMIVDQKAPHCASLPTPL